MRIDGPDAIGYLRIDDIAASTPHELRNMARQLENEGAQALVLDLRHLTGSCSPSRPSCSPIAFWIMVRSAESGPSNAR